jgi:iron complex transport system substrate-binding protein
MHRRAFIASGVGTATALLSGCSESSDGTGSTPSEERTATATTGAVEGDVTHTVSMEPMGPVEFEGVPDDWVALLPSYADMGVALDVGQSLGIQLPGRYASQFYEEIPGVSYDEGDVVTLNDGGVDKEVFYELDADVHFMEPNQLINWYDWDERDVEEVASNVGPFLGNFIRRRSDGWHDYPYYSLYGAFEKIATVFHREQRYEQIKALHDEFVESIQARLPEEQPTAMLLYPADPEPESFYPYRLYDGGVGKKQWRDLRLRDALDGTEVGHYAGDTSLEVDFETLLDVDPDVLLIRGQEGKDRAAFEETMVAHLRDHEVGSDLSAVQNDELYRGGYLDQGPIINLFQTERAAKRIYDDEFTEDELFDRQRLGDIVAGDAEGCRSRFI